MLVELLIAVVALVASPELGPEEPPSIMNNADDLHRQALENADLFGGDMLIPSGGNLGNAIADENYRWPDGVVPYVIDGSLSGKKALIEEAMQHYHDKTCVKFVERKSEKEYIKIFKGRGCYAALGRNKTYSQPQPLSLGDGCYKIGTVIHELGHVLGFYHEQNRSDRDEYLNIYLKNVKPGMARNFIKLSPKENLLINDFNYESIMIYGDYAFSKRPGVLKTMEAKDGTVLKNPYDKQAMTDSDIERVKSIYKC